MQGRGIGIIMHSVAAQRGCHWHAFAVWANQPPAYSSFAYRCLKFAGGIDYDTFSDVCKLSSASALRFWSQDTGQGSLKAQVSKGYAGEIWNSSQGYSSAEPEQTDLWSLSQRQPANVPCRNFPSPPCRPASSKPLRRRAQKWMQS